MNKGFHTLAKAFSKTTTSPYQDRQPYQRERLSKKEETLTQFIQASTIRKKKY